MGKRWWEPLAMLVMVVSLITMVSLRTPPVSYAYNPGNLLRLHVVAASDEEIDQELKLQVRNAVLQFLAPLLGDVETVEDARKLVEKSLPELQSVVMNTLTERNEQAPVRLELGQFQFPARSYGRVVVPAGDYDALRVIIGDGAGGNWWCVLFPPLCFLELDGVDVPDDDEVIAVLSPAGAGAIGYEYGNEIKLTWWTWKVLSEWRDDLSVVWSRLHLLLAGAEAR